VAPGYAVVITTAPIFTDGNDSELMPKTPETPKRIKNPVITIVNL
jgi:hypothetical protein